METRSVSDYGYTHTERHTDTHAHTHILFPITIYFFSDNSRYNQSGFYTHFKKYSFIGNRKGTLTSPIGTGQRNSEEKKAMWYFVAIAEVKLPFCVCPLFT